LNYGSFMQRPSFQYIFDSKNTVFWDAVNKVRTYAPNNLGNPLLRPQTTNSYDVGVMHGFGDGFTLDISGYYKDVKDLIQKCSFVGNKGSFSTYANRDYADIRGFRVVLNKKTGSFVGSMNYQYSVATGKSSGVSSAPPTFYADGTITEVYSKDILMDFDRNHNLLINLGYVTGENFGFRIGTFYPLSDIAVSSNSYLRSGRPFTYNAVSGQFDVNNMRTPWEYNTNVKISKKLRDFFGVQASIYLEVFNLFNNQTLNYKHIFEADDQGNTNTNTASYMTIPLESVYGLRYNNDRYSGKTQLSLDKGFLIYSNQPRSYNLGLSFEF